MSHGDPRQGIRTTPRQDRLDLLLILLVLAAGLAVRWFYVEAVVFPPLDDPAFYLTTAGNLVSGRGLVIDALWSYQIPFPGVTHPSHEHWMPLTTGLIASTFALLGSSLRTGQLPGMILGALLAPFTYLVGRRALPGGPRNRWVAFSAALLVAVNATLSYQSASADSSAPFALLAASALLFASPLRVTWLGAIITGLLVGLAYLTRSDGLLLLAAIPLTWWLLPPTAQTRYPGQRGRDHQGKEPQEEQPHTATVAPVPWRGSPEGRIRPGLAGLVMILAFVLLIAPWLVRNYFAFGTPLPSSVLSQARLTDYVDTFNYQTSPTWDRLFAQGWQALAHQRIEALLHNAGVFLLSTFPWGLLALPGLASLGLLRRRPIFSLPFVYGLLLFLVPAIIFPVSTVSGTFYHSLGAVVPFLALSAVYAVQWISERLGQARNIQGQRRSQRVPTGDSRPLARPQPRKALPILVGIIVGLVALAGAQAILTVPTVAERHQAEKEQFQAVATWLAQHAARGSVIMTTQPYTLNYASGYPAIVLPGNESPGAAWEAAQRYDAQLLVITQAFGNYPDILRLPDPRFRLLDSINGTEIYAIGGGQP